MNKNVLAPINKSLIYLFYFSSLNVLCFIELMDLNSMEKFNDSFVENLSTLLALSTITQWKTCLKRP